MWVMNESLDRACWNVQTKQVKNGQACLIDKLEIIFLDGVRLGYRCKGMLCEKHLLSILVYSSRHVSSITWEETDIIVVRY